MIAQMLCDFMLLNKNLMLNKPSTLAAISIYGTNWLQYPKPHWNTNLQNKTGGIQENEIKPLTDYLFDFKTPKF